MRKSSFVFIFIILLSADHLAADNSDTSLTIVVSDFDFSNITKEDMLEFVDYLAFQIRNAVDAGSAVAFSDLDVDVVRESKDFKRRSRVITDKSSHEYGISGVLERSERGYAVAILFTQAGSDSLQEAIEYAYGNENELYYGCNKIAIDVTVRISAVLTSGEMKGGLLADWSFDEAAGSVVYDESGNGADGKIEGAVYVDGISGTALLFDGIDDYVDTTDFNIPDSFTVSLWINPNTTDYWQCFIGKHTSENHNIVKFGYYDYLGTQGFSFNIRTDAHREGVMTTGWQHMVYTGEKTDHSTTLVAVYRNGILLWQKVLNAVIGNAHGRAWTIGQDWDPVGRTDFFTGIIDEVRIYGRALSGNEIQELFETTPQN
jgi:hypothetical protein